jgi:hypothetical protein
MNGRHRFGWTPDPAAVEAVLMRLPRPVFAECAAPIAESGKGQVALLHKVVASVRGAFPVRMQTIGDCVSQGWACAVDVLAAVQVAAGTTARYGGDTATEILYAGSRVEVGKGRLGRRDGSVGAYAAEFVVKYGTLPRGRYGEIDLTDYSGPRARQWGMPGRGVPDALEPLLAPNRVRTVSLVRTYEEARDALAQGYPVPVASSQGFAMSRDAKGFARPRGSWAHQMCFIAVDDADPRPGLLCMNSWGPDWISGPTRHDQPPGSFWVDAEVADRMLRQGDSFAASHYEGFPAQALDTSQY